MLRHQPGLSAVAILSAGFGLYAGLAGVVLLGSAAARAWPVRRVIRLDVADVLMGQR